MALSRDKSIEEKRREIDEELEEYSSRGIVSPTALKAARWLSRILWLAMSALVVVMIYQLNTRVPEAEYRKLETQAGELQADRKRLEADLDALKSQLSVEALRLGLVTVENAADADRVELLRAITAITRKSMAREDADALVIAELAAFVADQEQRQGVVAEEYAKAKDERKAVALARAAIEGGEGKAELFRAVAVARDAPKSSRVIAIRWLVANGRDEVSRKVLAQLALDVDALVAQEAAKGR